MAHFAVLMKCFSSFINYLSSVSGTLDLIPYDIVGPANVLKLVSFFTQKFMIIWKYEYNPGILTKFQILTFESLSLLLDTLHIK